MIGQTLGHCRIEAQLGAGGMGVVYLAHDQALERRVAVRERAFTELSDDYCVVAVPSDSDGHALRFAGFEPPADSRLLGVVPARDLRFEHRGEDFVYTASLSGALRQLAES